MSMEQGDNNYARKEVPVNTVESSLHQAIWDNHIRPEQAAAINHHHYHGPQPKELEMTNPYKKK